MERAVVGRLGRLIFAQLSPNEDLYNAILDVAAKEGIKTGLVLDITGGLNRVKLCMPVETGSVESSPGMLELEGLTEASGHGVIGETVESWHHAKSGVENEAGKPYLHVHLSVTTAGKTYTGHLIEGCLVRSLHPKSHFTIVLAAVEGVDLKLRVSEDRTREYPNGVPYHQVTAVN